MRPTNTYRLRNAWGTLAAAWDEFFHGSIDARTAALVRIAYAAVLLVNVADWYPRLTAWFGEGGLLPGEVARKLAHSQDWSLLYWLGSDDVALRTCYAALVVQTICLGCGLLTRFNAACVFVWLISFQNRNVLITDGEDTVFRLLAFFLIFIPSGAVWSVDAWLGRKLWPNRQPTSAEPRHISAWGMRLVQIEMCLIFFSAGLCKLYGSAWVDGTALYYIARLDEFGKFPLPNALFETPWVVQVLTWSVIAVELAVPWLVWFRDTRRPALLVAVAFHLANEYSMHLFLFHWVMLVGWLAFVRPEDWAWLKNLSGRGWRRGTADFAPARAGVD